MRRFAFSSSSAALGAAFLILVFTSLACGGESSSSADAAPSPEPAASSSAPAAQTPPSQAPPAQTPAPSPTAGGGDLGMVSSRGQRVATSAGSAGGGNGLAFTLPESWQEEPPSSSMRMAQAAIPGPGGDGQLTVFFFGVGGGGGVEANLQRWAGQVQAEAGAQPVRETFDTGSFKVHYLETAGTILPSQMGTGPTSPQPGQRLMGAVVEGPGGPWFFKATGPEATMDAQRDAFKKMLRELKPEA